MVKNSTKRYLNALRLTVEEPSFSYLAKIMNAHIFTLPFENVSKLIYYQENAWENYTPDTQSFVDNFEKYKFGGTCFTVNQKVAAILQDLGFDAYNINMGPEHIATVVRLQSEHILVDCAVSAPIFSPVRLERSDRNIYIYHDEKIVISPMDKENNLYEFKRYIKGTLTKDQWVFDAGLPRSQSYLDEMVARSHQQGAMFMSLLRLQIWQPTRNITLKNNRVRIYHPDGTTEKRELQSIEEIEEVVQHEFGLEKLPVRKAIECLEARGIDVFASLNKEEAF
ncbi:arylamine N-acetyltransferase [Marinococcus halophilus]|uniref:arylamine N-acetyltransferase n=1 Tax=Marinococcus halophilus TaxID=1371 RepID=UPI0015C45F08|nr:arylamine N-acetyltransferase [Marinococcus halophilus]